jgi:hypothetical protein
MVDRKARHAAAQLVIQFRDGLITNDEFSIPWVRTTDRALKAIATMLWNSYSDTRVERFDASNPIDPATRALFDRCVYFLRSDLEYEWPRDDLAWIEAYPKLLNGLTLGHLNRRLIAEQGRAEEEMRKAGDLEVWPFLRRADLEHSMTGKPTPA